MLFNSVQFLWFFPLIVCVWFAASRQLKPVVLLGASVWFYAAWDIRFLPMLFTCIGAAWAGGLLIRRSGPQTKKAWLVVSLLIPLGMLLFFKYYTFFNQSVATLAQRLDSSFSFPSLHLVLPIGISFFTFKSLSYLFDVYRGNVDPEKNVLSIANYIAFFPQILAGPIERAGNFLPQLAREHRMDVERIRDGLALMLWGLFKKAVIADNLATVVNWVYLAPREYPGLPLIVATYCYAFQIFCDFSGYSDMAIGAARVMGFSTMKNFNRPYAATSVGDFWHRWHISLSTWFRDYLYIPLGGNRVAYLRWSFNVLLVFLVSGLWHGAGWTFILWGGLHGLYLVGERTLAKPFAAVGRALRTDRAPAVHHALQIAITFHLVTFSWIFFRAESIADALYVAGHLFDGLGVSTLNLFRQGDLVTAAILVAVLMAGQFVRRSGSGLTWLRQRPLWIRWAVYGAMILATINVRPEFKSGFIYLQF